MVRAPTAGTSNHRPPSQIILHDMGSGWSTTGNLLPCSSQCLSFFDLTFVILGCIGQHFISNLQLPTERAAAAERAVASCGRNQ